jgi:carboxyl-terminal processing protease
MSGLTPNGPATAEALASLALKATALLAIAWLAAVALRRRCAAARHRVWALALAGLVALPALSSALPAWPLPWAAPWASAVVIGSPDVVQVRVPDLPPPLLAELPPLEGEAPEPAPGPPTPDASTVAPPSSMTVPPSPTTAPTAAVRPSWEWLLWAWAAGVLLALAPAAMGLLSLARLGARCTPLTEGPLARLAEDLAGRLGIGRPVLLMQGPWRSMPMTWGAVRPVVLLPAGAESWSAGRLRVVLLHELAHVRRWDCLTLLVAQLARALYWFHPLAWLAVARLRAEQERACDDAVLNAGADAPDYARHLLAITAGLPSAALLGPLAPGIGRAARIERRLVGILDGRQDRRPLPALARGLTALAALALLLALAPLAPGPAVAAPAPPAADVPAERPARGAADADQKLLDVRARILKHYVQAPDARALNEGAIRGMLEALHDPYSEYMTPELLALQDRHLRGSFSGIGAQLRMKGRQLIVVSLLEGSPALKAGLRPGTVIQEVDGKSVEGLSLNEVVQWVVGPDGSTIRLKVRHPDGQEEELSITRRQVRVTSVQGFRRGPDGRWDYRLDGEHQVGYLRVSNFGRTTTKEVREVVQGLQARGLRGLVLDLRFCPGGLISQAVDVTKLFLAKGTVVSVQGRGAGAHVWKADGKRALGDFPLVVLINEHSASAAEVVAGALQDNGRAVLVGTRTYGKGSVQEFVKLPEGGALKLTTAYYYLPGGRNVHRRPGAQSWGVDPDDGYYVPLSAARAEALLERMYRREALGGKGKGPQPNKVTPEALADQYGDPQLAAALRTMLARVRGGAFVKVGQPTAALLAYLARREVVEKKREELLKSLEQVDKELADLDRGKEDGQPQKGP